MKQREDLRFEIERRLKTAFFDVEMVTPPRIGEIQARFSVKEVIVGNQAQLPDANDLVVRLDEVETFAEQATLHDNRVRPIANLTVDFIIGNEGNQDDRIDIVMEKVHAALVAGGRKLTNDLGEDTAEFVRYAGYELTASENGQVVSGRATYEIGYPRRV